MGPTTRVGINVMFKRDNDENWSNIDSFAYDSPVTIDMSRFVGENETYEILIYPPTFSSLSKLEIEVPDDNKISLNNVIPSKNIVVAGGPHSFGIGCTTVNNKFSNILERNLDANVYNISYNKKDYLESIKDYYTNGKAPVSDVGIIEIDYYPQSESLIETELPPVIDLMKKKCKYLIGWYAIPPTKSFKKIIANNTIKEYIYNEKIDMIDFSFIYNDEYKEMCVYNNWFINDTANILIYTKLKEEIRRLTKWNI